MQVNIADALSSTLSDTIPVLPPVNQKTTDKEAIIRYPSSSNGMPAISAALLLVFLLNLSR